jgi:sRNA-binding protein
VVAWAVQGEAPHLLAIGIREAFFEDIAERGIPLSHKQVIKCLKSITRSELYLSSMIAGAERVDLHGNPVSVVTPDEESMLSCVLKNSDSNRPEFRMKSFKLY